MLDYDDEDDYVETSEDDIDVESLQVELDTTRNLLSRTQDQLENAEQIFIDSYLKPIHQLLKDVVQEQETLSSENMALSQDVMLLTEERDQIDNQLEIATVDLADKTAGLEYVQNEKENIRETYINAHNVLNAQLVEQKEMTNRLANELDGMVIENNNYKRALGNAKVQLDEAVQEKMENSGIRSRIANAFIFALLLAMILSGAYGTKLGLSYLYNHHNNTNVMETK